MLIGIQLPFFPLWLEAKGLDAAQIGIVLAAPAFVRVAAVPLLTRIADRHGGLRETLVGAAIAAAAGYAYVGLRSLSGTVHDASEYGDLYRPRKL